MPKAHQHLMIMSGATLFTFLVMNSWAVTISHLGIISIRKHWLVVLVIRIRSTMSSECRRLRLGTTT